MKYVSSAEEFFGTNEDPRITSLRESIMAVPVELWENLSTLTLTQYSPSTTQEADAILNHQLELLDRFDTIEEANAAENLLIQYGYNPVFLTLEGAYQDTLNSVNSINEGLLGMIKDFVMLMTEGGSAIGILQFVLDIIGLIPFSWAGIPIDTVANLLNAAISFYRGNYLIGCLNLVIAIPGFGQVIGGTLKGIIKPFAKIGEKLFATIWKGETMAIKAETMAFRAGALEIDAGAKASGGIIQTMGKALRGLGEFLTTSALKVIRGIASFIGEAINKVSFGLIPVPTSLLKWIDELALKMTSFGKGATEAGELLMKEEAKVVASGEKAAVAATDASKAAGVAVADADKIGAKFADIPGFNKAMQAEIIMSEEFKILMSKGASDSIQKMYIQGAMTEKLVGNILAKEGQISGKSLSELLKSPEVVAELSKSGSKIGDKVLADAIKTGDTAVISKVLDEVITNPALNKLVSPNVAKTAAIFKEAPELLVKGTQNLGKIQADLAKFTGRLAYRGISGRAFIVFILKAFLKGSSCAQYLLAGSPEEALTKVKSTASDKAGEITLNLVSTNEMLSKIVIETETSYMEKVGEEVTPEDLAKFKEVNPEGYEALMGQIDKTKEGTAKLAEDIKSSTNPCLGSASVAQAATGCVIKQPHIDSSKPVTNLTTPEEWEESGLNDYEASILKQLGEDSNIDAQHPLGDSNPLLRAYFSDVYIDNGKKGTYYPNESNESRLDATLNRMEKAGDIQSIDKSKIKSEVLTHWNEGTVPSEVLMRIGDNSLELKESFLKIGKLITRR